MSSQNPVRLDLNNKKNIRETRSTTNKNKRILEDLGLYEEGMGIDEMNNVLSMVSESSLAGAMRTIDVEDNSDSDNSHNQFQRNMNFQTPGSEEDYDKIYYYDEWMARCKVKKQKKHRTPAKRTPEVASIAISPYITKKISSTCDTDSDEDFAVMRDIAVQVCFHHEMNNDLGMDMEPPIDFSQTEGELDLNCNLNNSK